MSVGADVRLASRAFAAAGAAIAAMVTAAPAAATNGHRPAAVSHVGLKHGAMPTSAALTAPSSTPHLTYSGGPVVSNAQVTSVAWGTGSVYGTLGGFFGGVLRSPYISWLREYDTPAAPNGTGQHIGYGSYAGAGTLTPPSTVTTIVDDSDIQTALLDAVKAGTLPAPTLDSDGNVNTIYAVFFPHGDTITVDGTASGAPGGFCAYHGATTGTTDAGDHLLYMVLPDPTTGGMATGCGAHSALGNLESYTAHELIETITDPLVALAPPTTDAPPLAWYDDANGEIADICANLADPDGTTTGSDGAVYTVQKGWSNALGDCIVQRIPTAPSAPIGLTTTAKSGRRIQLGWSEPVNDGYSPVTGYDVYRSTSLGVRGRLVTTTATTAYTDKPPTDGRYYYTVRAVNAAGAGAASTQRVARADGTKPTVSMSAPSRLFSLASTATTKYVGSDTGSGVASYDVSYRVAPSNGRFGAVVSPAGWQHTTATHESLATTPGHEYCFTVVARDAVGNVSAPAVRHCQVTPLDERSFSRSAHWSTSSSSSAYRHTLTSTTTKGATLTLKGVRAHRLALVLQSCAKCGRVKVYVGKTLIATVDTHSATTRNKVIRLLSAFSLRTANVRLVAADSGKRVVVDGVGVSLT